MSTKISFTKSDLNAIKSIRERLAKMDEFLIRVKDTLSSQTKSKVTFCKKLEFGFYGILTKGKAGELVIGFWQLEDDDEMQIGLSLEDVSYSSKLFKQVNKELQLLKWEPLDNDKENKRTWYISNELSMFFVNDKFDANKAHRFIEQEVLKIKDLL